jgi:aspartate aminotransferase
MPRLAATVENTPHSGIRRMAELARRIPDVIRLDVGDPSFNTAAHVREAAFAAMAEGYTKYTPSGGYATLRRSLSEKVRSRNAIAAEPDDIVVTAGGCGGLFTSLMTLLDPGDEVLVPDPGWPNYRAMIHVLGATSVGYPVDLRGGTVDADVVESLVTDRTKAIIVNSPNNPTGAVYGADALADLAAVGAQKDLWVISDECYDEIVFDTTHMSIAAVAPSDRLITIFSFSKTYAMTGWRLGYAVASRAFADELLKAQEPVHGNASSVSQKAAEAALAGDQDQVSQMRSAYARRRGLALGMLDAAGVDHLVPDGAFYVMVDVSALGTSMDAALSLLEHDHLSVVPGSAFGECGEGWARVSLCIPDDTLREGLERMLGRLGR